MTDTTNTFNVPATPAAPATMSPLVSAVIAAFNAHIEQIVEAKVAAIVQSSNALKQIDASLLEQITEIVDERVNSVIETHYETADHPTPRDIQRVIEEDDTLATKDDIDDAVDDYFRKDSAEAAIERVVKKALENATVTIDI